MSEVQSGKTNNGFEWQRMTLTMEIPGFQGSTYKQVFQVTNVSVNKVLLYNIGDRVEVSWTMYAREWNGRMYNNVELVEINSLEEAKREEQPVQRAKQEPVQEVENATDDLPF